MDPITSMVIRNLAKLIPFAVKWYYTEERISKGIKIQVRSDHEGISVWGGELPHYQAWVEILNIGPFTLKIDRIFGCLNYSSDLSEFYCLEPIEMKPSEEKQILIGSSLTSNHEAFIQRMISINASSDITLNVNALIKTSVRTQVIKRSIRTKNFRFVNFKTSERIN